MSLVFIQNYQRIRRQFFAPRPEPVAPPPVVKVERPPIRTRYVYMQPIGPVQPSQETTYQRAHRILAEVCLKHGVSRIDVLGSNRKRTFVNARQEVFYRLCHETNWSLPRIGRFVGDRDHTTALHGRDQHAKRLADGEVKP